MNGRCACTCVWVRVYGVTWYSPIYAIKSGVLCQTQVSRAGTRKRLICNASVKCVHKSLCYITLVQRCYWIGTSYKIHLRFPSISQQIPFVSEICYTAFVNTKPRQIICLPMSERVNHISSIQWGVSECPYISVMFSCFKNACMFVCCSTLELHCIYVLVYRGIICCHGPKSLALACIIYEGRHSD